MILLLKQICKNNLKNTIFFSIFDQVVSYLLCIAKGTKEMNVLRVETGRKRGADNFWGCQYSSRHPPTPCTSSKSQSTAAQEENAILAWIKGL
jgi:hypothetical protein